LTLFCSALSDISHRQVKLFLALSRTPHGVIDMAAPAAAALLCLGHFPSLAITLVGCITLFAGYTAVYALNDVVDLNTDKEKVRIGGYDDGENYLDGVLTRHPMAKGALSLSAGMIWTVGWALVALAGAYWLNPICLIIFMGGCLLESLYCLLWRVTPLRSLVNGIVKTLGPVAAVYAVNPTPSLPFLMVLFLWIFLWEIGGQNIPADWTDMDEDRHFKAQTIPVKLGLKHASLISAATLVGALFLHLLLFWLSPLAFGPFALLALVGINVTLLLLPVLDLVQRRERPQAMALFNRASYYPLATLVLVLTKLSVIRF
jgi:4-hydroxybenzoate polyprenyltransferase